MTNIPKLRGSVVLRFAKQIVTCTKQLKIVVTKCFWIEFYGHTVVIHSVKGMTSHKQTDTKPIVFIENYHLHNALNSIHILVQDVNAKKA